MEANVDQRVRPGKTGYWIALLIVLIGCGGSGYLLYDGISSLGEGLVRAEVPGEIPITLDEAGSWTVFHESPSVLDGQTYNSPLPDGTSVSLTAGPGGEIAMTAATGSFTYDLAGRSGVSIGSFRVDQPGDYTLSVVYPPGAPSDPTVLAFGHEKGKATLKTVAGIAGVLASGFIAMLIFVIVLIMRSRSKNRLREAGAQA